MKLLILFLFSISLTSIWAQNGEKLFKKVDASVVAIQHERAGGSGFIISADGYILTNGHVVSLMDPENPKDTARRITVIMSDEKKYQAKVIGFSLDPDVALIKINPEKPLKPVKIGDADKVITGQTCYAFGAPLGQKRTLTGGIISNTARTSLGTFTKVFQMDAIINPGNSGGPLFNDAGEVISINTYGGKAGLGFSIPIKYAMVMKEHYLKHGRFIRADLPFFISKAMPEEFARVIGTPQGVYVDYVVPGSYAEKIGMKNRDVIIKMDDEVVSGKNEESYYEWNWDLVTKNVKDKITFTLLRKINDKWTTVKVNGVLREDDPAPQYGHQIGELKEINYPTLGLGFQRITQSAYFIYNLPSTKGVRVSSVKKNSSAGKAKLAKNHVITHINNSPISSEDDFRVKIDTALKKMTKYLVMKVVYGNDTKNIVMRVSYHLRKRQILIISTGKNEHLAMYKRQLELQGAKVVTSDKPDSYGKGDWDGVIICSPAKLDNKVYKKIIATVTEKKQVLGLVDKAPALLIHAPKAYKEKKVTMNKDISPEAIKAGLNYTGKDVESDATVVSSTGFDKKIAKAFLESFAGTVSRKTEARK